MLNEGKNEGESLALLIWALEMSLMALQYTLPPLTECKSREGEEREGGMGLISFINVAIDRIRASREREELQQRREIGERVRDVGRKRK